MDVRIAELGNIYARLGKSLLEARGNTIGSAIFGLLIWLHSNHGHGNMTMDTRRIP
jgi:hypothetical protein